MEYKATFFKTNLFYLFLNILKLYVRLVGIY